MIEGCSGYQILRYVPDGAFKEREKTIGLMRLATEQHPLPGICFTYHKCMLIAENTHPEENREEPNDICKPEAEVGHQALAYLTLC